MENLIHAMNVQRHTHTHSHLRILTEGINLQIQSLMLAPFSKGEGAKKKNKKEGEGERWWLSWADIFWEPVLRLPGAIFKRPTSPHCLVDAGETDGVYACKHAHMRTYTEATYAHIHRGHTAQLLVGTQLKQVKPQRTIIPTQVDKHIYSGLSFFMRVCDE